ncbi:hypothetical protein M407DRAFT_11580 [Tulasnella calospora MUT 4182]|uniref:Uncharacterized protein n=1 Tax=Tulasnella calospora MUT 4182 TaxID=1051891 RepID=A0A0C3KC84_9AGAM|nr:hypothetical protein M407DRAFT_11580 [Tulasnella calospora MUT 4182]
MNRHTSGFLLVEASSNNALEVEYDEEDDMDEPRTLYIPDHQVAHYDVLGIKWSRSNVANSTSGDASWKSEGLVATNPWKISSNSEGDVTISAMNGFTCMYSASTGTGAGVKFYKDKPAFNVASYRTDPPRYQATAACFCDGTLKHKLDSADKDGTVGAGAFSSSTAVRLPEVQTLGYIETLEENIVDVTIVPFCNMKHGL